MAHPSDQFRFSLLPREIRDMIFKEYFRSAPVILHKETQAKRIAHKPTRVNSATKLFRVSKNFHNEARPHFLANAAFHIASDSRRNTEPAAFSPLTDLEHIVLTDKVSHPLGRIITEPGLSAITGFKEYLRSDLQPRFSTITYDRVFRTASQKVGNGPTQVPDEQDLVSFVNSSLRSAGALIFPMRPDDSHSPEQNCDVTINSGGVIKVQGRFMGDAENVAKTLCKLFVFDPSTVCILKKTFGRPTSKIITIREIRKLAGLDQDDE